jgi:hypothetical protein
MRRLAVALLFLLCCARREHSVERYEKDGIRFSVPSACDVAADKYLNEQHTRRAIHIECSDHAVFSIISIPANTSETLEMFARNVASKRATAIEKKLSVSDVNLGHETAPTFENAATTIHGAPAQGVRNRFSVELLGQNIPHVAEFYMLQSSRSKVFLMTQVAERHLEDTRPRWKAVFDTLEVE